MGVQIDGVAPGVVIPVSMDAPAITIRVDITRPANATGYTANDVINDIAAQQLKIPNAVRKPGGGAYLQSVTVIGDQAAGGGAETWKPVVWIHRAPRPTLLADNAAFTGTFTIMQQTGFLYETGTMLALAAPAGSTFDKSVSSNIAFLLTAAPDRQDFFFDLQTLTAFTPGSGAKYAILFTLIQL